MLHVLDALSLSPVITNTGTKVELEALYTLGMDVLTGRFLETAIIREDYI